MNKKLSLEISLLSFNIFNLKIEIHIYKTILKQKKSDSQKLSNKNNMVTFEEVYNRRMLSSQIILIGNPSHPTSLCLSMENSNNGSSNTVELLNYLSHGITKGATYFHGYWNTKIYISYVFA